MADTPKRVIRLIDNIKLELYESGRKKYVQVWDPTGNNTYNEDDKGPSGIKSPERSKKYSSAEADDDIIHDFIERYSQIVGYYYNRSNRSRRSEYFNYLQDPFSETPPPKRVYGGGGLGTPEVDNVGPTPYYLNNGCKINIKWTGRVPNPDFKLGTFSTPEEAEDYNESLSPEGPPRWLSDQPILSDIDEADYKENPTLRPQSEWILETYYNPGNLVTPGKTYSNYRDKPYVQDKFVTITLPDGFTENGGKGYLEYIGSGYGWGKGLVYSTSPKGAATSYGKLPSVLDNFAYWQEDKDILQTVITEYKMGVSQVNKIADFTDYPLKACFPDTGTCSLIPYKSPIVDLSEVVTAPIVVGVTPSPTLKKIKLNVFGLPGVTSLSGQTDGTIKIKAKVSLPDFTVYIGDPPGSTVSNPSELNPFGLVEDDVENPDPYEETPYKGPDGDGENINTPGEITQNVNEANSSTVNSTNTPPQGTPAQGNYNVENIEPDTPFDASQLPVPPGFNNVPLYFQYDKRWSKYNYGVGKKMTCSGKGAGTVESSGCMPSSLSMIINYWAKKGYCKPTRPDVVAQFCVDYGGRVCGQGGNLQLVPKDKFKEVFGLNIVAFGTSTTHIGDEKVRTLLRKGFPVNHGGATTGKTAKGASKSYGGHYLVMTGIDDQGRIRVNDSGNGPMGGKAITYYSSDKWSSANTSNTSQSYLYPDALGDPLK